MKYTDTNDERIRLLNLQILLSIIFIGTTLTAIIISYNERNYLKYNKRFIDKKKSNNIVKINRTIIIILLLGYIYINEKNKELDKRNGIDTTADNLEILASFLTLISALIILYVIFNYRNDDITITENPNI
ncbi:MAG TPA: hypothetical protein PLV83_00845 [Bacilli bacterium]|nr:hypothetical protein [Bacilli bacterium]